MFSDLLVCLGLPRKPRDSASRSRPLLLRQREALTLGRAAATGRNGPQRECWVHVRGCRNWHAACSGANDVCPAPIGRAIMIKTQSLVLVFSQVAGGCMLVPASDLDAGIDGAVPSIEQPGTGGSPSAVSTSSTGGSQSSSVSASPDAGSTCGESFEACGGDPSGTWEISDVCVQGDLTAVANAEYSKDATSCAALCSSASLNARGFVTYEAGTYTANAVLTISESLQATQACYEALSNAPWSSSSCTALTQMLQTDHSTTASCANTGSGCDCAYTSSSVAQDAAYTVSGTSLIASDGTATEFCVQGSMMMQRDTLASNVYVVTQLTKR